MSDQCVVWKMSGDSLGTHVRSVCSLEDVWLQLRYTDVSRHVKQLECIDIREVK